MKLSTSLPALLLAAITAGTTHADVIVSNFTSSAGTGTAFGNGSTTQYKAFGFTMGAADYTLSEVLLSLDSTAPMPTPVVEIWSDAGGTPGASLFTLDNPIAPIAGPSDYSFTAGTPFALAAGTSYWLYVQPDPVNADAFSWDGTNPALLPNGPGATAINYEFNGGVSSFLNRLEIRGDSIGTNFCMANLNSTGSAAEISAIGSSLASANDVTLQVSELPGFAFGFFIVSQMQGFVPNPGGSSGNLCLAGSIGRYVGPGQIQQSDAQGTFSLTIDLSSVPQPLGSSSVQPGDVWNFQAWYRDTAAGQPTSNFTNGLEVSFQ